MRKKKLKEVAQTHPDPDVRRAAMYALGSVADAWGHLPLPAILSIMRSQNADIAYQGSFALRSHPALAFPKKYPKAFSTIAAELKTTIDDFKRRMLIRALGMMRDRRAVAILVAELKDVSSTNKQEALQALGTIGDRRAIPAIKAVLNDHEEDRDIRKKAAAVLRQWIKSRSKVIPRK